MVGMRTAIAYPNGLTASWTYDANNQLLQVRNATPTNVISQFDYTYDAAGRRTAIAKSGSAFGDLSGSVDAYTYNARSELISARRTKNGQPIPGFSEDFDYDPIGNRRSSSTYNERGEAQTSTYEANNLNQYTSRTTPGYAAVRGEADPNATVTVNENPTFRLGSYYFGSDLFDNSTAGGLANLETYATLAQTAANGEEAEDLVSAMTNQVYLAQLPETFAYDDDGNQTLITTKTGLWRVEYNGENRPVRWTREGDGKMVAMSYDHMGRRRTKDGQRFFYDGYLQVANERTVSNAVVRQSFVWDPTEPVATRPLTWQRGNSAAYYVVDANKNVSEVVDSDGSLAAHYEYAPFGAVILQRGESAATNPWRFSSEYAEDDTATVYYNYRHYEPVMGRWMQRDPIALSKGYDFLTNLTMNRFDFLGAYGNPVSGPNGPIGPANPYDPGGCYNPTRLKADCDHLEYELYLKCPTLGSCVKTAWQTCCCAWNCRNQARRISESVYRVVSEMHRDVVAGWWVGNLVSVWGYGYGCVDWQMAVVDAVNDSADANSSCFKAIGVGALYPFTKWTIHNWAKIFGPDVPYLHTPYIRRFKGIEIDPWPSGGARLFPDSFRDIDLPTYWK